MAARENELTRRDLFSLTTAGVISSALPSGPTCAAEASKRIRPADEPFGYCLNTSTIRGQNLPLTKEAELASAAGFQALEPWISELDDHKKSGATLQSLARQLKDLGLTVESAIGFFDWIVDDDTKRKKALDEAKRNMELVREVGGSRLAAPPAGATDRSDIDPKRIAERYRALLEIGDQMGVVPQAEVWGFSKTLGNLAEAAQAAIGADHPKACILADVYHLYKGGSGFNGLRLLNGRALHVIHLNDYPADPPRAKINDSDRVYPGDGVAPLTQVFRDLRSIGFEGYLSVELFNRQYWKDDAADVLKTAIGKLRGVVKKSFV